MKLWAIWQEFRRGVSVYAGSALSWTTAKTYRVAVAFLLAAIFGFSMGWFVLAPKLMN